MESGSSNATTAVLEKGSTCLISGDDGTSAIDGKKNYYYILIIEDMCVYIY